MKLIKNENNEYAVRWGIWPYYRYLDLHNPGFWWGKYSAYYTHCWRDQEIAQYWYSMLNEKITVVKPKPEIQK